jgi:hypothetical protein
MDCGCSCWHYFILASDLTEQGFAFQKLASEKICGSLMRSQGGRELGSRSPRTRWGIARLQRFAVRALQFALSAKCYAVLPGSSAPRADEQAVWDTLRSREPGSLRAMPSQFETSCAIWRYQPTTSSDESKFICWHLTAVEFGDGFGDPLDLFWPQLWKHRKR